MHRQRWFRFVPMGILSASIMGLLWLCLGGCSSNLSHAVLHDYPPQTQEVHLALAPDAAYAKAYKAIGKMDGGRVVSSDAALRALVGEVVYAVQLNVQVEPFGTGSLVTIRGTVLPHKFVVGEFHEVQTYAALLQENH
jgi:hypothetical protein